MGKETESKVKARMQQWQAYVESGFVENDEEQVVEAVTEQAPPVTIYDTAQMFGNVYEAEREAAYQVAAPAASMRASERVGVATSPRAHTIEYREPNGARPPLGRVVQAVVYDETVRPIPRPGSRHSFEERNVPGAARKKRFFPRMELRPERRADLYLAGWVTLALVMIVTCVVVSIHLSR